MNGSKVAKTIKVSTNAYYKQIGIIMEFIIIYTYPDGREGYAIIKAYNENHAVEIFTRGYGDDVDIIEIYRK